ncbi:MAG: DUF6155 family protein [Muribaculaceae bacterium]|nr:DUF6155 family protein [Muribaculaceae bacterium]
MSKASLRKTLNGFTAPQLLDIILDLYSKSREAKEILDFFASPDLDKKSDEYLNLIIKEIYRTRHYVPAMRVREIRSIIKRFSKLEPGDEAVARLMVNTILEICKYAKNNYLEENKVEQVVKLFSDTLKELCSTRLFEEYAPRLRKTLSEIRPNDKYCYIRTELMRELKRAEEGNFSDEDDDFLAN